MEVTGGDRCCGYGTDTLTSRRRGAPHCVSAPGKLPGGLLCPCGVGHSRPLRKGTDASPPAAGPVSLRVRVPAGTPLSAEIRRLPWLVVQAGSRLRGGAPPQSRGQGGGSQESPRLLRAHSLLVCPECPGADAIPSCSRGGPGSEKGTVAQCGRGALRPGCVSRGPALVASVSWMGPGSGARLPLHCWAVHRHLLTETSLRGLFLGGRGQHFHELSRVNKGKEGWDPPPPPQAHPCP